MGRRPVREAAQIRRAAERIEHHAAAEGFEAKTLMAQILAACLGEPELMRNLADEEDVA